MSHGLDEILRYFLLALLWLFFLYAARMVIVDIRRSRGARQDVGAGVEANSRRQQLRLRVVAPDKLKGQSYEVNGELTLGRSSGCAITLDEDSYASSVHARIYERDGELWVEDLGSTNGTYVNDGQLERPVKVRRGDEIRVGSTSFELTR